MIVESILLKDKVYSDVSHTEPNGIYSGVVRAEPSSNLIHAMQLQGCFALSPLSWGSSAVCISPRAKSYSGSQALAGQSLKSLLK